MVTAAPPMDPPPAPQRSWWRRNQQRVTPWLFLAPGMLMFLVYVIWPIFQSFWLSFYDWDGLGEKVWLGWANYVELFDDDAFYTSLWNNVLWLVLYLLAVPAGLAEQATSLLHILTIAYKRNRKKVELHIGGKLDVFLVDIGQCGGRYPAALEVDTFMI